MAISEGVSRRIVDFLNDGEELGIEGTAVGTAPRSPSSARSRLPRFRWPRLVRLGTKCGGGKGKGEEDGEEADVVVMVEGEHPPVAASTSVLESATTRDTRHSDLSVGLSLVFLLAKTSDEFSKMAKVRSEMEALLSEIKQQVRETTTSSGNVHHDVANPREPESTTSSCVTDRNDRREGTAHHEDHATSSDAKASSCEKSWKDECGVQMDILEEEFHTELERLQVNYGSDTPSLLADEEEYDAELSDEFSDADYGHGDNQDLGEIVEDEDDDGGDDGTERNGVSAVELERRLHELLHERNRDRIGELEDALRRAEKMLAEKEMDVCLWKDTAKFALRQENELQ